MTDYMREEGPDWAAAYNAALTGFTSRGMRASSAVDAAIVVADATVEKLHARAQDRAKKEEEATKARLREWLGTWFVMQHGLWRMTAFDIAHDDVRFVSRAAPGAANQWNCSISRIGAGGPRPITKDEIRHDIACHLTTLIGVNVPDEAVDLRWVGGDPESGPPTIVDVHLYNKRIDRDTWLGLASPTIPLCAWSDTPTG